LPLNSVNKCKNESEKILKDKENNREWLSRWVSPPLKRAKSGSESTKVSIENELKTDAI
jgi:hypothetical protein